MASNFAIAKYKIGDGRELTGSSRKKKMNVPDRMKAMKVIKA